MLQQAIQYLQMPDPLIVLGLFFSIYAIFEIIHCIYRGFWRGIVRNLANTIVNYKRNIIISLMVIILFIFFVDLPITKLCKYYYNVNVYSLIDFISAMGESWFIIGFLIDLSLIFKLLNRNQHGLILQISYMAALYAGLFNLIVKFIFNRQRPSIGLDHLNFFSFFLSDSRKLDWLTYAYNSMPSGHTVTTFAAILPLFVYLKNPLYKALLLFFGITIAFSRLYTINHWTSDVCLSILIGSLIGITMYSTNKHRLH